MKRNARYSVSTLACLSCGAYMYVPRMESRRRPDGHIKDMWCPLCKARRKFVEYGAAGSMAISMAEKMAG